MWVLVEEQEDADSGLWVLVEIHGPYSSQEEAKADKPRVFTLPRGRGRVTIVAWRLQGKENE